VTLRVMTWNLWWRFGPWEERQPAIEAVVAEQRPDVLLLQEVWSDGGTSVAQRLAGALGGEAVLTTNRRADEGGVGFHNAIVSRWPLGAVEERPLPRADGRPGHRRILLAEVATPWGAWPVASTHLDYQFDQSAVRQSQVAAVLDAVADRRGDPTVDLPVIVGGDFNAIPDSDEIRMITGRSAPPRPGVLLSDCWEHVGDGPGPTWRRDNPYQVDTAWPQRRLDYVFVSWPRPKPIGSPVAAWLAGVDPVDGVVPSDHASVVVELVTPAGSD
jgi:endonuclease/exonuclease/phosphatase family metal-dependent hydrolase